MSDEEENIQSDYVKWHGRFDMGEVGVEGDPRDPYIRELISGGQQILNDATRNREETTKLNSEMLDFAKEYAPHLIAGMSRGSATTAPGVHVNVDQEIQHGMETLRFLKWAVEKGWTFEISGGDDVIGVAASHPVHGEVAANDECLSCAVEEVADLLRPFSEQMDS